MNKVDSLRNERERDVPFGARLSVETELGYIDAALSHADQTEEKGALVEKVEITDDVDKTPAANQVHKLKESTLEKNRIVTPKYHNSETSSAYKILRTQVAKILLQNNWNRLAIFSAREGQGSTLTATNLAFFMSILHGYKITLADINFKKPSVHKGLGLELHKGINDCLLGDSNVDEVLAHIDGYDLSIMPCLDEIDNSSEVLMSPKFKEVITDITSPRKNEIVIMDMPPALSADDVLASIDHWDASLIVIQHGVTKEKDLKKTLDLIAQKPVIGTVYNNVAF
ncbi:MAG: CpsD/CapB family tyrosine-protein kinase [Pseudomonadales bacterium]|nr:CpsD/CapB family tyrosine-protein kinase [Pseudomonadales bacterium]